MFNPNKIVIVGGNAAGPSAAAKAKRTNPDADVIMLEAGEFISIGTCEFPYVLSGEIDDFKKIVFFDSESFEREKGVKVYTRHLVESINRRKKELSVRDLRTDTHYDIIYDSLVLCTGSNAKSLPDIPDSTSNVFTLKSVSDLIRIKEFTKTINRGSNCLVIGAGYIGLEAADALNKVGYNVTIAELASHPFPGSEPEVQTIISGLLEKNNVKFIAGAGDIKYLFENNRLARYKHDGRTINVDLVLIAAGVEPNTQLAFSSGLELGRYNGLKVDRKLRTSDASIFAAGDNMEVQNLLTGKPDYIPQATIAHAHGHIAGANAAGGNEFAKSVIKNLAFKIFDKSVCQVGLTLEEARMQYFNIASVSAEVGNLVKVMPGASRTFGKIVYDQTDKKLLGASFVGDREAAANADIISTMISGKMPANQLAETFYNYTPPLTPFINLLSVLGRKITRN